MHEILHNVGGRVANTIIMEFEQPILSERVKNTALYFAIMLIESDFFQSIT